MAMFQIQNFLDPKTDPGPDPLTCLNPDPIRIRIENPGDNASLSFLSDNCEHCTHSAQLWTRFDPKPCQIAWFAYN